MSSKHRTFKQYKQKITDNRDKTKKVREAGGFPNIETKEYFENTFSAL